MVMTFETRGMGVEYPAGLLQRPLQTAYAMSVALAGVALFYLVINQGLSRQAPSQSLQEIRAAAEKAGIAERSAIIKNLEAEMISEPLDLEILKQLSIYWAAAGDSARSEDLALILAQRSLREVEAQAMALDISLRKQDFGQALKILDGILRTKEKSQKTLFQCHFFWRQADKEQFA